MAFRNEGDTELGGSFVFYFKFWYCASCVRFFFLERFLATDYTVLDLLDMNQQGCNTLVCLSLYFVICADETGVFYFCIVQLQLISVFVFVNLFQRVIKTSKVINIEGFFFLKIL